MKQEEIKAALDRVLTWPSDRQEDAVRVLAEMEQQSISDLSLTDEQIAETHHRLADPDPKFLSLEAVRARFVHRRR